MITSQAINQSENNKTGESLKPIGQEQSKANNTCIHHITRDINLMNLSHKRPRKAHKKHQSNQRVKDRYHITAHMEMRFHE